MIRSASGRTGELQIGGTCALRCPLCDCGRDASSDADVARMLASGLARLTLRGTVERNPFALDVIKHAREAKVGEIVVRTNALAFTSADAARGLARSGATAVLVPLFSQVEAVHDQIAGRPSAHAQALKGMAAFANAGLDVEIETPLLDAKLQNLDALIEQARIAAPSLRAIRFFVPNFSVPAVLAPPDWKVGSERLARALARCRTHEIRAELSALEGVPLCALRDYPDLLDAHRFDPKAKSSTGGGSKLGSACATCAMKRSCPGIAQSYREMHGESGIVPYATKPIQLKAQRTTPLRKWTEEQREAASQKAILVLRPTVNCNQDCTFCSANETTENVWQNRESMLRQIARAARTGIRRVSFSGGEPTLSKDLPAYVQAASRLGIEDIEIVTNGVLLDSEKKVAALRDAGLTNAFVSLHAHDERLSQAMTQKVGDYDRTLKAIHLLLGAGIRTVLNHVISARNYPHLQSFVEMVHREFGGRVRISFAFVTPQYKALEDLDQVPRLPDVAPYLRRALRRALALGQPCVVGSRQGVPPCFLGEFRAWSDIFHMSANARAEDAPQKQRAATCDSCRYSKQCLGVWNPYAARYGTAELRPIAGAPLTEADVVSYKHGVPMSFDEVPESQRDHAAEIEPLDPPVVPLTRLPIFVPHRSRPLRILVVGSGKQARRLIRAARNVPGISIDAVASPHAPEADLRDLVACPTYRDVAEAMADMRPDAIIIASSTGSHVAIARLALAQKIPALIEKPLTSDESDAAELASATGVIVAAHNDLHAVGLDAIFSAPGPITYSRRRRSDSPDSPRTWNRGALSETLYHALSVVGRAAGGGVPEVASVSYSGDSRPKRIRAELRYGVIQCDLVLDFAVAEDDDRLTRTAETELTWRRSKGSVTLTDSSGTRAIPGDGDDVSRMLASFRDTVLGKSPPAATARDAADVMRATRVVLEALEREGAPFARETAPKHVASRELRTT